MINYRTRSPDKPDFEGDYVVLPLDIGNGGRGQFGLSYLNKSRGAFAMGTRRTLSNPLAGQRDLMDCRHAFSTLQTLQEERNLTLGFQLVDPCPVKGSPLEQQPLQRLPLVAVK